MKHVLIGAKDRSRINMLLQNKIFMKPTELDISWLEQQRKTLLEKGVKTIIGYPSVIKALAEFCKSKGDTAANFNITGIIATSEPLYEETREIAEKIFGCAVVGRYASEELGVIAHECIQERNYHLNEASYKIELLAIDEDRPVTRGELGRVVVTDLYSHAMPLIRYDTGDLAVLKENFKCKCGFDSPVFERIEGRNVEIIYNTSGIRISPFAINSTMRDINHVFQFQFIQKNASLYILRLSVLDSYIKGETESIILTRLKNVLGNDAEIILEYTSTIPPLKSGKRPYIISEYKK